MITDHRFVGRRQDGINPPPTTPCVTCGQALSQHTKFCPSSLMLKGEHFPCELVVPHDGWAHQNRTIEAIWSEGNYAE